MNDLPEISLTLEPDNTAVQNAAADSDEVVRTAVNEVEAAAPLDEARLSPEEQKLVADFAKQIDLRNSAQILKYGSSAQEKVASFADTALANVNTKELGEVGDMILDLVGELREFRPDEEKKGLARLFSRQSNKLEALKGKYDKAATSVEKMCIMLEEHQRVLLKDIARISN